MVDLLVGWPIGVFVYTPARNEAFVRLMQAVFVPRSVPKLATSVNADYDNDAGLRNTRRPYCSFAYLSAVTLDISTETTGSSPTTQASWPGGITYASPGPNSSSVPSSNLTCSRPETW